MEIEVLIVTLSFRASEGSLYGRVWPIGAALQDPTVVVGLSPRETT